MLPQSLKKLIAKLTELPSIGPRQATRLAVHLANLLPADIEELGGEILTLKNIKHCARCFFIHENGGDLCSICENKPRRQEIILVVEKETDLVTIENTGKFSGRYFIIGQIKKSGVLEPWQKERLARLREQIASLPDQTAAEIILGFNPTSHGDFNASLIARELAGLAKKMTRLGRGLPQGGEIEFADDDTLGSALDSRA